MSEENPTPSEEGPKSSNPKGGKTGIKWSWVLAGLLGLVAIGVFGNVFQGMSGQAGGEGTTGCGGAYYDEDRGQLIGADGQAVELDAEGNIQQTSSALTDKEKKQKHLVELLLLL